MNARRWRTRLMRAADWIGASAVILIALTVTLLLAVVLPIRADDSEAAKAWRAALPRTPIDAVRPVEGITGLVEIASGSRVFYGDAAGKVLLVGNLYDVRANRDLTQERTEALSAQTRIPWSSLPLAHAISVGQGQTDVAIFVDPHCGWCRKLYGVLKDAKPLRARLVLLPQSDAATETARRILCAPQPDEALARIYAGGELPPSTCAQADPAITDAQAFARAHGITATPAIVAGDGRVRLGFQPLPALLAWIGSPPSPTTEARKP